MLFTPSVRKTHQLSTKLTVRAREVVKDLTATRNHRSLKHGPRFPQIAHVSITTGITFRFYSIMHGCVFFFCCRYGARLLTWIHAVESVHDFLGFIIHVVFKKPTLSDPYASGVHIP